MTPLRLLAGFALAYLLVVFGASVDAQPPGFGGERKVLKTYDTNGDGRLDADERKAARAALKKSGGGKGGFGKGGKGGKGEEPGRPGPKVAPSDVKSYPDAGLYDPNTLRTIFLEFEEPDWEAELEEFHGTDVDVPATVTVDGKKYANVGVHFRGMSSYGMVPAGSKRSFNLAADLADPKQKILGAKTLNLLNMHEDNSLLSTVLYSHVARKHLPAPRANFVRVVVNGESWGVYTNVEQFNKDFVAENFPKSVSKGADRWKVKGSPGGRGGLEYLGDDASAYKRIYTIKSDDKPEAWAALAKLCKTLAETPAGELEAALTPMLDIDNALWFLALDVALVNGDGFWTRASDYTIVLGHDGKFRLVPHDMNESFAQSGGGRGGPGGGPGGGGRGPGGRPGGRPAPGMIFPPFLADELGLSDSQKKELADVQKDVDAGLAKILTETQQKQIKEGPGGRGPGGGGPGGMGGGGPTLDPLVGLTDTRKALRSKLLAVPKLRERYLGFVREIAEKDLDWKSLGPVVAGYRELLGEAVEADTRKLSSTEAFMRATAEDATTGRGLTLKQFAEQRRKFLLDYRPR